MTDLEKKAEDVVNKLQPLESECDKKWVHDDVTRQSLRKGRMEIQKLYEPIILTALKEVAEEGFELGKKCQGRIAFARYLKDTEQQAERIRELEDWIIDYGWDSYGNLNGFNCGCGERIADGVSGECPNPNCKRAQIQKARASE